MKLKTDKPKKVAPAQKALPSIPQRESIIHRIFHIVIEDIRYKFGRKDTRTDIEKAREKEMVYKDFRERFG
jgi:hypothetical protein